MSNTRESGLEAGFGSDMEDDLSVLMRGGGHDEDVRSVRSSNTVDMLSALGRDESIFGDTLDDEADGMGRGEALAEGLTDSVMDARAFPICMDRYYDTDHHLLEVPSEWVKSIVAHQKVFEVVDCNAQPKRHIGNTWSFVARCTTVALPDHLQKVIYLFEVLNAMAGHMRQLNNFVVPSDNIGTVDSPAHLAPVTNAQNSRLITGVVLKTFQEQEVEEPSVRHASGRGVDMAKLLELGGATQTGVVQTPVDLFEISVSFTGAKFKVGRTSAQDREAELQERIGRGAGHDGSDEDADATRQRCNRTTHFDESDHRFGRGRDIDVVQDESASSIGGSGGRDGMGEDGRFPLFDRGGDDDMGGDVRRSLLGDAFEEEEDEDGEASDDDYVDTSGRVGSKRACGGRVRGESGRDGRVLFAIVRICSPGNVDAWGLVRDVLLAAPQSRGSSMSSNFKEANVRHCELHRLVQQVLIYQASAVLEGPSKNLPQSFYMDPGGVLGIDNLCCPAYEPLKMARMIRDEFRTAEDVKIIGYPDIDWCSNPDEPGSRLNDYIKYVTAWVRNQKESRKTLDEAIADYVSLVDRSSGGKRKRDDDDSSPQTPPPGGRGGGEGESVGAAAGRGRGGGGGGMLGGRGGRRAGRGGGGASGADHSASLDRCDTDSVRSFSSASGRSGGGGGDANKMYKLARYFGFPTKILSRSQLYGGFVASWAPINMVLRRLYKMNVQEEFKCWAVNLGSLPPLVVYLLRSFMLFDPDNSQASKLDDVLLRDLETRASLDIIESRFYTSKVSQYDMIARPLCQLQNYLDIVKHIRASVGGKNTASSARMTPHTATRMYEKMMENGVNTLESMIASNAFMSSRVRQALEIIETVDRMTKQGKYDPNRELRTYRRRLLGPASQRETWIPYDEARQFFYAGLLDMNRFENLNSVNLSIKIEILISMCAYCFGSSSDTIQYIGMGIELSPGCGTLEFIMQNSRARVTACPNTSGKDFTMNIVSKNIKSWCMRLGIDSEQHPVVLKRYTAAAVESACAIARNAQGHIVIVPEHQVNGTFYAETESRGSAQEMKANGYALIQHVYVRGDAVNKQASLTTVEGENRSRAVLNREQINVMYFVMRCSNQNPQDSEGREANNTIYAVVPNHEPGSTPYVEKQTDGTFGTVVMNMFESKSVPMDQLREELSGTLIGFTHISCTTLLGLGNFIGNYTREISPPVNAALDWMVFYLDKHTECMWHQRVRGKNFSRILSTATNRAAALCAWIKTQQFLTQCRSREEAMLRALLSHQFDAVALTDLGNLAFGLMRRCISWGPVIVSVCYMRETRMPIVPLNVLIDLLQRSPERIPNDEEDDEQVCHWYRRVVSWLDDCVNKDRFCKHEDQITGAGASGQGGERAVGLTHYCEYISSDGIRETGDVEQGGVFRVSSSTNFWKDNERRLILRMLAKSTCNRFGEELAHALAMNEDTLVCAMEDMLAGAFTVELQKLLGVKLFNMERHFRFFKLHSRLVFQYPRDGSTTKTPMMVRSTWRRPDQQVKDSTTSIGVGIHVIQLLVLGSLVGDFAVNKFHPKIINDLSRALVKRVLLHAPRDMTPTDTVDIRTFNCISGDLEPIDMSEYEQLSCEMTDDDGMAPVERPRSFLRPLGANFADKGDISVCRNFLNLAPEDILHMGSVCELANRIGCKKIYEIPPTPYLSYYPCADKKYCIYNHDKKLTGTLEIIKSQRKVIMCWETGGGVANQQAASFGSWHNVMIDEGFIMLPMIWRDGACVRVNVDGADLVGCIACPREADLKYSSYVMRSPDDTRLIDGRLAESVDLSDDCVEGKFGYSRQNYWAKVQRTVFVRVGVIDVLDRLLPIGHELFLRLESNSAMPYRSRLSSHVERGQLAKYAIRVRLASPDTIKHSEDGRVYVAIFNLHAGGSQCEIAIVDPWEVLIAPDGRKVIKEVMGGTNW